MALQQMPHGMCMFDGSDTLLLANRHYGQIWGLPAELLRAGTSFAEIMAHTHGREVECTRAAPPAPAGSAGVRRCEWLLHDFKAVNDLFGHSTGDSLLRQVADRLRDCAHKADLIVRLGGDEFAVLQCGEPQPAASTALALRMIEALSQPYDLDGHCVRIGTSIGLSMAPGDGVDPDTLLKNADCALYQAKGGGRGTFRYFRP